MKPEPTRYNLTLRVLPGHRLPGWMRLRAGLKRLLRNHGLKAEVCKPVEGKEQEGKWWEQ